MITRLWAGTRRHGTSGVDFRRHWRDVHAGLALRLPGLQAYVQNHVVTTPHGRAAVPVFDGCSELDFADLAAMQTAFRAPQMHDANVDERIFADPDRFAVVVTERHVVSGEGHVDSPARVLSFMRANQRQGRGALLEVLGGAYDNLAMQAGAIGHEVLVAVDHAGELQASDVVDSLWFPSLDDARAALERSANDFAAALAGWTFGREVALVMPYRLR